MGKQLFLNNFDWLFVAPVKATPSTDTPDVELGYGILQISSAAASFLPNPGNGDFYVMTTYKRAGSVESQVEIIKVLGVDEAVYAAANETRLRVLRGQEGTMPQAYVASDHISLRLTSGGAQNFVQGSANLADLEDATAARTHLGLGTAAMANTGTGATQVVLGNDARLVDSRVPKGGAGGVLSGTYPNPGFAVPMATQAEVNTAIATREPTVIEGTSQQYWRGDKTWRDLWGDVRSTALAGLSTASSAVVTASDTLLGAVGKLQAQLGLKAPINSPAFTGTVSGITPAMVGLGSVNNTADADKPISTAVSLALANKASAQHVHDASTLTGTFTGGVIVKSGAAIESHLGFRANYSISFPDISPNSTDWYRIATLSGSQGSLLDFYFVIPGAHVLIKVRFAKTTAYGNTGSGLLDVEVLGTYAYEKVHPFQWRIVEFGTNGASHLDIRFTKGDGVFGNDLYGRGVIFHVIGFVAAASVLSFQKIGPAAGNGVKNYSFVAGTSGEFTYPRFTLNGSNGKYVATDYSFNRITGTAASA